jgi:hypothetical protein
MPSDLSAVRTFDAISDPAPHILRSCKDRYAYDTLKESMIEGSCGHKKPRAVYALGVWKFVTSIRLLQLGGACRGMGVPAASSSPGVCRGFYAKTPAALVRWAGLGPTTCFFARAPGFVKEAYAMDQSSTPTLDRRSFLKTVGRFGRLATAGSILPLGPLMPGSRAGLQAKTQTPSRSSSRWRRAAPTAFLIRRLPPHPARCGSVIARLADCFITVPTCRRRYECT